MKITVFAVGTKMPNWVQTAWQEFAKRMPKECAVELHEIKPESRNQSKNTQQIMLAEANRINHAIPDRSWRVILDEHGKDISTKDLSNNLRKWLTSGNDIAIIIGGPDGLDKDLKQTANQTIKLSSLTLPHPMVRVLLAEQLYRAWSIINNHPYHRE